MTLAAAKELLRTNNIPFEVCEYKNDEEYRHDAMLFPYTENAKPCKVIVLSSAVKTERKTLRYSLMQLIMITALKNLGSEITATNCLMKKRRRYCVVPSICFSGGAKKLRRFCIY